MLSLDSDIKKYNLTKLIQRKFTGNLTQFEDKMVFNNSYITPCENDNFINKNKLSISVDSITYHSGWKNSTKHRKPKKLLFLISKDEEKIILTK